LFVDLIGSFNKLVLLSFKFSLHDTDRAFGLDQTIVTVGVTILEVLNFSTLLTKENLKGTNELQVRGWGHVVVSPELLHEFPGGILSVLMELLHHFTAVFSDCVLHLNFTKELLGDRLKGILGPL